MTEGVESQKTHVRQTHVRRQELIFLVNCDDAEIS